MFDEQTFANKMAAMITVVKLKHLGGYAPDPGNAYLRNRGMTLSVIADTISDVFQSKDVDVEVSLPNLIKILENLTRDTDNTPWLIKPEGGKTYFYRIDESSEAELLDQLAKLEKCLIAGLEFIKLEKKNLQGI